MMLVGIIFSLVVGALVGGLAYFKLDFWNLTKVQNIITSTIIGVVCFLAIAISGFVTIDGETKKWNHGNCTSVSCNGEWEYGS